MRVDVLVAVQQNPQNFSLLVLLDDALLTEVLHHPVHQLRQVPGGDIQQEGA